MNRRSILAVLAAMAASPVLAQKAPTHRHGFGDAQHWSQVFDDPKRDAMQKPHEVIKALALRPDAMVADIGAGTGYFTVRLAHFVPKGRVYAVDVEPEMVKFLAERAKREKLANVTAVTGSKDDARLPGKVDVVLMVDVLHHIDNRVAYLRRLSGSLKADGRIAIIDFRPEAPSGPPRAERLAPQAVKEELKRAGFALVQEHGFLPQQYFLVFRQAS